MMSEGELKLILVQIHYELKFHEERLERMKKNHIPVTLQLLKCIELRDKGKALEADWLATTGTEWRSK